ncbi:MAG: hypothetical protein ACRDXX_05745 [Stackebrandtia sp.]
MNDDAGTVIVLGIFEVEGRRVSAVTRPGSTSVWLDVIRGGETLNDLGTVRHIDTDRPAFHPADRHRDWSSRPPTRELIKDRAQQLYLDHRAEAGE